MANLQISAFSPTLQTVSYFPLAQLMPDNKAVVAQFYALSNAGEIDLCFELLSDDLTWTDIGTTCFAGTYRGKQAVMEQLLGPLFGQLQGGIRMEIDDMIMEGNKVVAEGRGFALTQSGDAYNNSYCQIFTLRNGKICAVTEYCDTALVNQVLGKSQGGHCRPEV